MVDNDEVAPSTAEETQNNDEGFVSISDIAEASGLESQVFDSASEETEEVLEENEEQEEVYDDPEPEESTENPVDTDSEGVKKRIGKLIEARNKAYDEVAELKEQLQKKAEEEPEREVVTPKGLDKFDNITSYKELKEAEENAEHLREWLLENPDGGEYTEPNSDITHEVDYEQARQLSVATDRDLRKNIPHVAQRLSERDKNQSQAMQIFDWMKDNSSPENVEINSILKQNKFISDYYKKDPFASLTVGYAIEGIKAVNARLAQKTKVQSAPKVPSAPSRATPTAVKAKGKNSKALLKQAMSGEIEDASSYIESIL
jgi:hypothetical protein